MSEQAIHMIDLTKPTEHQKWLAINDNVMGGISTGRLTYDGKSCQFQGELSLVNNGGFSSIKRLLEPLPKEVNTVKLTFVGDGSSYQLRLTMWKDGSSIHYKHEFSTIKGKSQQKVVNLTDFQAVFRGRLLNEAPELIANDIKHVGFLIADKQTQAFSLNLFQIQFTT